MSGLDTWLDSVDRGKPPAGLKQESGDEIYVLERSLQLKFVVEGGGMRQAAWLGSLCNVLTEA